MERSDVLRELRRIRLERGLSYRFLAALISSESSGAAVSYSTIRALLESPDPRPFATTEHVLRGWVVRELQRERRRKRTRRPGGATR